MAFRFDLPDIDDCYALADWFEIMLMRSGKTQLSRARMVDALVAKLGASASELDGPMNFLFAEFARRRRIAGLGYPFSTDNKIFALDATANRSFYTFLLLISVEGPMRRARRFGEVDKIFDYVVGAAAVGYFGVGTKTIRFGSPVSSGRPSNFAKAVEWLSTETGIPVGSGVLRSESKDGGLDVIAWKPFNDRRSAFAVALIQCTVQADWFPKAKDLVDDLWRGRLDTGRSVLTTLAVPFVIPRNYGKWDDLRRTVSVVLDRLRLAQFLANTSDSAFAEMIAWNQSELAKFAP